MRSDGRETTSAISVASGVSPTYETQGSHLCSIISISPPLPPSLSLPPASPLSYSSATFQNRNMSILVISVNLECCRCKAKIQKVLECLKEEYCIEKIEYDEKKNKVIVRGKFDAEKLRKKIMCKACKVVNGIEIVKEWPPKEKPDKPKPPETPKPDCCNVVPLPYPLPYPVPSQCPPPCNCCPKPPPPPCPPPPPPPPPPCNCCPKPPPPPCPPPPPQPPCNCCNCKPRPPCDCSKPGDCGCHKPPICRPPCPPTCPPICRPPCPPTCPPICPPHWPPWPPVCEDNSSPCSIL